MRNQDGCGTAVSRGVKRRTRTSDNNLIENQVLLDLLIDSMRDTSDMLGIPLDRDIQTVTDRYNTEGFGFISKTLPLFQDWLRSCLASGHFSPCSVFKTHYEMQDGQKVRFPFPSFLRGLVSELANDDGSIIELTPENQERQGVVLISINLVCTSFGKKYELPLPDGKREKQILDWFQSDDHVFNMLNAPDPSQDSVLCQVVAHARFTLENLFMPYTKYDVNPETGNHERKLVSLNFDLEKPSHGSGATSYGLANHEKYTRLLGFPLNYCGPDSYSQCLALFVPSDEPNVWVPSGKEDSDRLKSWARGGISKVAVVPKNSSKGRIICMEPAENMLVQQGYREALYNWVESNPITAGFVNFRDQSINGSLALTASRSGYRATLDLKAASDSVSRDLVRLLFPDWVYRYLDSCRSKFARAQINIYKGGKRVGKRKLERKLMKYAPMGSALCFPVEALVFWALARSVLYVAGSDDTNVWVYGDDIILPAEYSSDVTDLFKKLSLFINTEKSFTTGYFRESCGVDAYKGIDVSAPVRCKTRLPGYGIHKRTSSTDAASDQATRVVAWVEYANLFETAGLPRVSDRIRRVMGQLWPSSRSFPRLSTPYEGGFLHFLDYKQGRQVLTLGRKERKVGKHMGVYNYTPLFPNPPPGPWVTTQQDGKSASCQGELFTFNTRPYYQGRVFKGWMLENGPESVPMNEHERFLRSNLEGVSQSPSDQFVTRGKSRLCRKGFVVS